MKFLVDADMPRGTKQLLERAGHGAVDVRDIGLAAAADSAIATSALEAGLCLRTGDFGFADVRNYPPSNFNGIVVVQVPRDAIARVIISIIETLLDRADIVAKLPGRLCILSPGRVRLRPA